MRKGFKSMAMLLCACMILEMACGSAFAKQPEEDKVASTLEEAAPEVTAESDASTDAAETEAAEGQEAPAEEPKSSPAGELEDGTEPEDGADADDTAEPAADAGQNEAAKPADDAEQEKDTKPAVDADQEKEAESMDDDAEQDSVKESAADAELEEAADPETTVAEPESEGKTVASADESIGKTTQNEVVPIAEDGYYVVLDESETKLTFQNDAPEDGSEGTDWWRQASVDNVYNNKVKWREYKGQITSVEFQDVITLNGYNMFEGFSALKTVTVSSTVELSSAFDMFGNCSSLRTVSGLSNFNMSGVINMMYMFTQCSSLTELDLGSWNTSSVTNMNGVFNGCSNLETLNGISQWNTSAVQSIENIFEYCSSLTKLDLSNWNTENVTDERNMFRGCTSLRKLTVGPRFRMKGNDVGAEVIHDSDTGFWVNDDDPAGPRWTDAQFIKLFEGGNAAGTYIWGHRLTYNANGRKGTVPKDITVYGDGDSATLLGQGRIQPNYDQEVFIGWSEKITNLVMTKEGADAANVLEEGDNLKFENTDKIVYAVWAEDKNKNGKPDYEEKKVKITFTINGGDGSKDPNHKTTFTEQVVSGIEFDLPRYEQLKWSKEWEKDGKHAAYPAVLAGWAYLPFEEIIPEDDIDDEDKYPNTTADSLHLSHAVREPHITVAEDTILYAIYAADENGDGDPDFLENAEQVEYYANGGKMVNGGWLGGMEGLFYRCGHHHVAGEKVTLITLERGKGMIKRDGAVLLGWSDKKAELVTSKDAEKSAGIITEYKMPGGGNGKVYAVWAEDDDRDGTPDYAEANAEEPPEDLEEKPPVEEPPAEKPDHPYWNFHTGIYGASSVQNANAGWVQDANGWQYYYANGTFAASKWELINGKWYYFKPNGYMMTGWQPIGGHWYHLDEADGDMDTGWYLDLSDGRWYYLDASGAMLTGWQLVSGKYYYLSEVAGAPTYTYNAALKKWIYDGTGRPFGSMYANETTPDGYTVDASGAWVQ